MYLDHMYLVSNIIHAILSLCGVAVQICGPEGIRDRSIDMDMDMKMRKM